MPDVTAAKDIADFLVLREWRRHGDLNNAMRRIAGRYGLSYSVLWALRYRPPQDILLRNWMRLVSAYEVECARQQRLFEAERKKARALGHAANSIALRSADRIAGARDKGKA